MDTKLFKYSKLLKGQNPEATPEKLLEYQKMASDFCIGKTTSHYISLVGKIMKNPEIVYEMKDNLEYSYTNDSARSYHTRETYRGVVSLIEKLGLKYFVFDIRNYSITYQPYGYFKYKLVED